MSKIRTILTTVIAGGFLVAGTAAASAALDPAEPPASVHSVRGGEHPECYDSVKANDPADFCYQVIGPWNSRLLTNEEVAARFSSDEMAGNGLTPDEIRKYHPEYTSTK